ncbi:MAG: thiamine phosphate synthase [Ndongobacter sp.]|nr:thiamine phosphate synthase [Ndongobacter sp.]
MGKPCLDMSLYAITDAEAMKRSDFPDRLRAMLENGVTLVQLRDKEGSVRERLARARWIKAICDEYDVPLLIDDRVDIALGTDAAGVHVGAEDMPVALARRLLGPDKIVGATAKTVERAIEAERDGADYIGTGAIYPTATKVVTKLTGVETLKQICRSVSIPVNAIGGLTAENIDILQDSGISGICVVGALMRTESPGEAARRLRGKLAQLRIGRRASL